MSFNQPRLLAMCSPWKFFRSSLICMWHLCVTSRIARTEWMSPFWQAKWRAVCPCLSIKLTSAPPSTSFSTRYFWWVITARCNGVWKTKVIHELPCCSWKSLVVSISFCERSRGHQISFCRCYFIFLGWKYLLSWLVLFVHSKTISQPREIRCIDQVRSNWLDMALLSHLLVKEVGEYQAKSTS